MRTIIELVTMNLKESLQSDARYRDLFDHLPLGLYRSTPSGQILDANQALVQMLGYPDCEALLEKPMWLRDM